MNIYSSLYPILWYLCSLVIILNTILYIAFFIHTAQKKSYIAKDVSNREKNNLRNIVLYPHTSTLIFIVLYHIILYNTITYSAFFFAMSLWIVWIFPKYITYLYKSIKNSPKKFHITPRVKRLFTLMIFVFMALIGGGYYLINTLEMNSSIMTWGYSYIIIEKYIDAIIWIPYLIFVAVCMIYGSITLLNTANYYEKQFVQNYYIRKAKKKLSQMPHLTIIGITGSYGKSTTKHLISSILNERYVVCMAPASYNTMMGICKVINHHLQPHHQILILEMGARRRGEIAELCKIASPNIAIVTNVGIAHLETYGSIENIFLTKSEIIQNMKANGIAILNSQDKKVKTMATIRNDIKVVLTDENYIKLKSWAYTTHGLSFTYHKDGIDININLKLLGKHNINNAILAIAVGYVMNMPHTLIKNGLDHCLPVTHRLELKKRMISNIEINMLDDAFNSNPIGAYNALQVLNDLPFEKKYIITPGMVELGEKQYEMNYQYGKQIAEIKPNGIFLVNSTASKAIYKGIHDNNPLLPITECHALSVAEHHLSRLVTPQDIVLYENDLPDISPTSPISSIM